MLQAIGTVLPLGLAVALSSVPIMATTFILLSANRDRTTLPFVAGWVIGIFVVALLFTAGFSVLPRRATSARDPLLGWIEIVLGIALMVLAWFVWRRTQGARPQSTPKWLSAVGRLGPVPAFGLALGMNIRPKAILISATAGVAINTTDADLSDSLVALAVYTAVGASSVLAPVIFTYASPDRAERMLLRTRSWLAANSAVVTVIVVAMTGVVVFGNGLSRL
jgi:hypothetical protein